MKKFKFLFLLISLLVCSGQLAKAQTKVGIFVENPTGLDDDEQAIMTGLLVMITYRGWIR